MIINLLINEKITNDLLLDQRDRDTSSGRLSPRPIFSPSILTTTNTSSTGPSPSDGTPQWSCPTEGWSKSGIIPRGRNSTSWSPNLDLRTPTWLWGTKHRRWRPLWPGWSQTASLRATEKASWRIWGNISTLIFLAIVIKVRIRKRDFFPGIIHSTR